MRPHDMLWRTPARLHVLVRVLFAVFAMRPRRKRILQAVPGRTGITQQCRRAVALPGCCLRLLAETCPFAASFFPAIRFLPEALTNTAGFRLKSVDGREQVSLSPVQVAASWMPIQITRVCVDRSDSFLFTSCLKLSVLAAHPVPLLYGFCACNIVYSIFKLHMKVRKGFLH